MVSFERLENRYLLAASLASGVLTVTGTIGPDAITLVKSGTSIRVSVGTTIQSFSASAVNRIVARGLSGNDTINLSRIDKPSLIDGGPGNDILTGGSSNDTLIGGLGADVLKGGGAADTADYSTATKMLTITIDGIANDGVAKERDNIGTDIENIIGGAAGDIITGSSAANVIRGGAGDDTINGGAGDDDLYGDAGNDILTGNAGTDWLVGGDGIDTASYAEKTNQLTITMGDSAFNDGEVGEGDNVASSIERLIGGSAGDNITGNISDNLIDGGAGNDTILGGSGNDTLLGNAGDDNLSGHDQNDSLVGGLGADMMRGGF